MAIEEAVILAAGEGTRMRPLTAYTPKPLLFVGGRPYLDVLLDRLREVSIKRVHLVIGHEGNTIMDHIRESDVGMEVEFVQQKERKGTAHALGQMDGKVHDGFVCLNGDVLFPPGFLGRMVSDVETTGTSAMAVYAHPEPERFGLVQTDDDGQVTRIIEKTPGLTGKINAGIYCFTEDVFQAIRDTPLSSRGEYEITTTINNMTLERPFGAPEVEGYWMDIGRPWDLLKANELLLSEMVPVIEGEVEDGAVLKGPVHVGEGSVVRSGSYIVGPVHIGRDCDIGPNAFIRGSSAFGDKSKVGAASEVKNTIVMGSSNIPHHNYVGDSIIGKGCNLGSGTKTANLRLDKGNITVVLKGERVKTGRRKLGVIMGDNVQTGINSMLNTGSIIGEDSLIGPGALAIGTIAPRSRIQ